MRTAIAIAIAIAAAQGGGTRAAAPASLGAARPPALEAPAVIGELVPALQKSTERFRESLRLAARHQDKRVRSRAGSLGDRLRDAVRRLQPRDRADNQAAGVALAVLRSARDVHDFLDDHALNDEARRDWFALLPLLNRLAEYYGEPPIDGVIVEADQGLAFSPSQASAPRQR